MTTHICKSISSMREFGDAWRAEKLRIGFVPTMGALHAGHAELLKRARAECDKVVCSIFVNPTQFGPKEDFALYPRTWEADQALCVELGVDAIFAPDAREIYRPNDCTHVEVAELSDQLCGVFRKGHFRGVTTVVYKLFAIVEPDVAYFGEKDFQQLVIIERMVKDLYLAVRIVPVPTVREADGLALSSRNRYLSAAERAQAAKIGKALSMTKYLVQGEMAADDLLEYVFIELRDANITQIDYIALVDSHTLRPTKDPHGARLCVAAYVGTTRLIDNVGFP